MKKTLIVMAALAVSTAFAAEVDVTRKGLGSGTPAKMQLSNSGVENAKVVNSSPDVLHTPQYLPGFPTAATIFPRIVEVPCTKVAATGDLKCSGYHWTPAMGRAEYLFVTPVVKEEAAPVVVKERVVVEKLVPGPVREVFVEVPAKKKAE